MYSCLVFLDLRKAFDTVTHNILLTKLDHYGIGDNGYNLLQSYLQNRQQYVSINNYTSKKITVKD